MARQLWISGNYGDVRRDEIVIRTAQRAIGLDPSYAQAWALLAIAQASLRYHYGRDVDDGLAAAEEALRLDPTLAAVSGARPQLAAEGDFERAEVKSAAGWSLTPNQMGVNRDAARQVMQLGELTRRVSIHVAASLDENDFHSCMMLTTCFQALGLPERMSDAARQIWNAVKRVSPKTVSLHRHWE